MSEKVTDYKPGDSPAPLGVEVEYFGSQHHGLYTVEQYQNPANHPQALREDFLPEETYPDGVAYVLWPVGVPKKFGNRDLSVVWGRRTSFRVVVSGEVPPTPMPPDAASVLDSKGELE